MLWVVLIIFSSLIIGRSEDDEPTAANENSTDLYMTALTVSPTTVTTREFSACSFYIRNDGPDLLSNEYLQVDYYLSTDSSFDDTADIKIGDTGFTLSIASEGSYQINLNLNGLENMVRSWPVDEPAGDYYLFATVAIVYPPPSDPDSSNNYVRAASVITYSP